METLFFLESMVLNNSQSLIKTARCHSTESRSPSSKMAHTHSHRNESARAPSPHPVSPYRQRQSHADEGELFDVGRGDRGACVRQLIAGVILGRQKGSDDKAGLALAEPPGSQRAPCFI